MPLHLFSDPLQRVLGERSASRFADRQTRTSLGEGVMQVPALVIIKEALLPSEWVTLGRFSDFWEHTGEHLETEVLLIPAAVGAALDHADLVVEAFDEPQGNLVLRLAIRRDAVPMRLHQPRELLVRLQTLPAQRRLPLVEEPSCPAGTPVVPELIERLLEQVGLVQASVGLEQQLQRLLPIEAEVFPMGHPRA